MVQNQSNTSLDHYEQSDVKYKQKILRHWFIYNDSIIKNFTTANKRSLRNGHSAEAGREYAYSLAFTLLPPYILYNLHGRG